MLSWPNNNISTTSPPPPPPSWQRNYWEFFCGVSWILCRRLSSFLLHRCTIYYYLLRNACNINKVDSGMAITGTLPPPRPPRRHPTKDRNDFLLSLALCVWTGLRFPAAADSCLRPSAACFRQNNHPREGGAGCWLKRRSNAMPPEERAFWHFLFNLYVCTQYLAQNFVWVGVRIK